MRRPHGNSADSAKLISTANVVPFMTLGIVKDTDDPSQMGRLRVYCPSIDTDSYEIEDLPWATYISPFAGATLDNVVGRAKEKINGITAYGFWAIPNVGSMVVIGFLDGNPSVRFWLGCAYPTTTISTIPGGRQFSETGSYGAFTEENNVLTHVMRQAKNAGLDKGTYYKTRGPYERQVSQAVTNNKDGSEGYSKNTTNGNYLNSDVVCLSTPGGSYLTMCDAPEHCRARLRTIAGNQIILDDTNERIYISTADGDTWIELDEDGHIHMFGAKSVSVAAGSDLNLVAGNNINLSAGGQINAIGTGGVNIDSNGAINISSGGDTLISACAELGLTGVSALNATSQAVLNLSADANLVMSGAAVHINGQSADKAKTATGANRPSVVPSHEPWKRPASGKQRGPNWKE